MQYDNRQVSTVKEGRRRALYKECQIQSTMGNFLFYGALVSSPNPPNRRFWSAVYQPPYKIE